MPSSCPVDMLACGAGRMLAGLRHHARDDTEPGPDAARGGAAAISRWRIGAMSFGVVFIGEWGDITQITTANFTARYHDALTVALGAGAGLIAISGLAILAGAKILDRIPERPLRLGSAAVLAAFGAYTAIQALTG